jgi:hypothetical protein
MRTTKTTITVFELIFLSNFSEVKRNGMEKDMNISEIVRISDIGDSDTATLPRYVINAIQTNSQVHIVTAFNEPNLKL